ncbi:SixA phosphatase family protein [Olleya aquimaris]|uniref:Histidine phosphatase superfamily protein (Branch 1) n=1 Tax=Olleya aquimaris TaxID=639310 RepID=A0A327RJG3_9FLAO|nr:phosphoglycerate mutase family protein [Olleya aquimaris]RAJ17140.1 histidine phosphatase superfamily protein (branch 1) [Olleya aquimaris]
MKKIILIVGIILVSCLVFIAFTKQEDSNQTTTYYFIRHAEKNRSDATNKNPDLTTKGKRRAKLWQRHFKNKKLDAIYSTNYNRTLATARPTAEDQNLTITIYDPRNIDYQEFKNQTKGQSVLVVGHSNTTPSFVNAIINQEKYQDIDDSINYKLFIVTITDGKITDKVIDIK